MSGTLARLVNTMVWSHAAPKDLAWARIRKLPAHISRGGDLVPGDRLPTEDAVRAAKSCLLQVRTARAGLLISSSDAM
jgi:hypothetical protein